MKKNRKKKGFTLIELIVVIAVLAILALIAVPRLAGFTDRAEMANDKEYAAIGANSIQMLIATEEVTLSAPTGTDRTASYNGTWTGDGIASAVTGETLDDLIKALGGTETLEYYASFAIEVPDSGEIDKDLHIAYTPKP